MMVWACTQTIIHMTNKTTNVVGSTSQYKTAQNKKERLKTSLLRGATGIRTRDTRIFSPLLYQLSYIRDVFFRERMMGFEPTTSTLARLRSTTELHPRYLLWYVLAFDGEDGAIIHVCARFARLFLKKMDFLLFLGEKSAE